MTETGDDGQAAEAEAKRRLWLMTLVRLAGFVVVLFGMWTAGQSDGRDWMMLLGLGLMGAGAGLLLFGPRALAGRWKP
jgi:protein-S-isoprenylcysteine O-methyltransferase Ste14